MATKVIWHPGELIHESALIQFTAQAPRTRPAERVVAFYNQRGTAEQGIGGDIVARDRRAAPTMVARMNAWSAVRINRVP